MSVLSLQTKSLSGANVISSQSAASANESAFVNSAGPTATLRSYLQLSFMSGSPSNQYTVDVHAERIYTIKYYDVTMQQIRTVTGKVMGLNSEVIALLQTQVLSNANKVCLNLNQDKLAGYIGTEVIQIPVVNITACVPVLDDTEIEAPKNKERYDRIMAVIGLSSHVVRAIMVDIKVFDDEISHAVNEIRMEIGGTYHVDYVSNDGKGDTMYEIEGRLVNIQEVEQFGSEPALNGYVRPDCPHEAEEVGYQGNVYYNADYFHSLPKSNPDATRIKFTFDTSKAFEKSFDSFTLAQIRNVWKIQTSTGTEFGNEDSGDWPEFKADPNPEPPPVQMPYPVQGVYPPMGGFPPPPPPPPHPGMYPPPPPPHYPKANHHHESPEDYHGHNHLHPWDGGYEEPSDY